MMQAVKVTQVHVSGEVITVLTSPGCTIVMPPGAVPPEGEITPANVPTHSVIKVKDLPYMAKLQDGSAAPLHPDQIPTIIAVIARAKIAMN